MGSQDGCLTSVSVGLLQVLKLQESPDAVPKGEMPRHMQLYCDRYLTDRVVPGNRITVIGIYSIRKAGIKPAKVWDCLQKPHQLSQHYSVSLSSRHGTRLAVRGSAGRISVSLGLRWTQRALGVPAVSPSPLGRRRS